MASGRGNFIGVAAGGAGGGLASYGIVAIFQYASELLGWIKTFPGSESMLLSQTGQHGAWLINKLGYLSAYVSPDIASLLVIGAGILVGAIMFGKIGSMFDSASSKAINRLRRAPAG
jgi:hypothetical protein